jgi:hypothetical protein
MFKAYVYVVRKKEYLKKQESVYEVGFCSGEGHSTYQTLCNVDKHSEVILIQQMDNEVSTLQQVQIREVLRSSFAKHESNSQCYIADPWALRSVIHSATTAKSGTSFTEKFGSIESKEQVGYIYLVRLKNEGNNTYKVGMTRQSPSTYIHRLSAYRNKEIVLVSQADRFMVFAYEQMIISNFNSTFLSAGGKEYFEGDWQKMVDVIHSVLLGPLLPPKNLNIHLPEFGIIQSPNTDRQKLVGYFLVRYLPTIKAAHFQITQPDLRDEFHKSMETLVKWSDHEVDDRIHNYIMSFETRGVELRMGFPFPYHTYVISVCNLLWSIKGSW